MKLVTKIGLGMATVSVLFLSGCSESAPTTKVEPTESVAQPTITEESLGLRKVDLYSEDSVEPDETKYSKEYAGSGKMFNRSFQDAPPMIPHDVEGMLPIRINDNQCAGCHMPEVASTMAATAIPSSHFTDFRPKHTYDGKEFKKSTDVMKNEVVIQESTKLAGARFNCTQCHAPQSEGELVENTFTPVFTTKDGNKKSSWSGSNLTEGLDTLME